MNLVPLAFSMAAVTIWSSCLEPVPPIFILLGPAALTASTYCLAFWYGDSALTHSTKLSSAIIDTGVMSRQLKGTPVASGVVNRLDSVTTILCGSPLAFFTSRKPSAPAPPDLLTTTSGCFIRLCLTTMPWIRRAIWSAPPPVPAGTTNSTGLAGSQAAWAVGAAKSAADATRTDAVAVREDLMFESLTLLSPEGSARTHLLMNRHSLRDRVAWSNQRGPGSLDCGQFFGREKPV